jgi:hypothetical protein
VPVDDIAGIGRIWKRPTTGTTLPRRERTRDGLPEGVFDGFAGRQRPLGLPIGVSASGRTMSVCQLMSLSTDFDVVDIRHGGFLFGRPFWQDLRTAGWSRRCNPPFADDKEASYGFACNAPYELPETRSVDPKTVVVDGKVRNVSLAAGYPEIPTGRTRPRIPVRHFATGLPRLRLFPFALVSS